MTQPAPDNAAALEFLKLVYSEGPWVVTAIHPDRKGIETSTFHPSTEADALEWLRTYNGTWNIYRSTNPPTRDDVTKKMGREDIREVAYLHVDVDPRVGEDLASERVRLAALFNEKLPAGVPAPTIVLFSGGGYQAFWKLETPIPVNGDLGLAEDAKRYNQQLELLFGGDNCHNIDRIMRLPGTINVPDERKRKKGRVPELARLVTWAPENVYPISAFKQAPMASAAPVATGPAQSIDTANIKRLADIDELNRYGVPDRVKVICVQGNLPDEPKQGDNSRSIWVFDAACGLARANVPDEVIYSILTDPKFGISESVLELGRNADRYALRQIERAKNDVMDPWLRKLNADHFVLTNENGKVVVAEWKREPLPGRMETRDVLSMQTFPAFRDRYLNQTVQVPVLGKEGKFKEKQIADMWLRHPQRREYTSLTFYPAGEQVIDGYYNLWRGFGVEPKEGDWSLMEAHIREVLANGDPASEKYMLNWAAFAVQHAALPAEVALVFKGGHGVGKGVFARSLMKLFGAHGMQVSHPSHLSGRFNSHMRNTCLLFADEAMAPQDKAATGVIKTLLTEPDIQIEGKGANLLTCPNHVKVVMASNEEWVAAVARDDRRFAVFDVAPKKKDNKAYFKPLYDQMDNGGLAAMLHALQHRDLDKWHPREIPETQARADQKNASISGFARVFFDWLETGILPTSASPLSDKLRNQNRPTPFVSTAELTEFYKAHRAHTDPPATFNAVADLFNRLGFRKVRIKDMSGYLLPPLREARKMWDGMQAPGKWSAHSDEQWSWTPFPKQQS